MGMTVNQTVQQRKRIYDAEDDFVMKHQYYLIKKSNSKETADVSNAWLMCTRVKK
jgi:hypothetical protein